MIKALALVGPTATGKSELALEVADKIDSEIVSVDSAQVYIGMDIGTAKPTLADRQRVRHHMIDVVDASSDFSVAEFQRRARSSIADIDQRASIPLLVGGSGLYFRAVVDPLEFPGTDPKVRLRLDAEAEELGADELHARLVGADPDAAERIEKGNVRRIVRALEVIEITGRAFSSFRTGWDEYKSIYDLSIAGLRLPRDELRRRIEERVDEMVAGGLVEETLRLVEDGYRESLTSVQAIGYSQVLDHLDGKTSLDEVIEEIKIRTRRFARRQLSWFQSDPRIVWFDSNPADAAKYLIGGMG